MLTEIEEAAKEASSPEEQRAYERYKRLVAAGWPMPRPETICFTCTHVRYVVAYEPVGWLVSRKPESKPPKQPSRTSLQRRLRAAEAEAKRLRDQLDQLEGTEGASEG